MLKVFTTFTGIGSQEMALRNIKLPYEVVGISEVDRYALQAYDAIHNTQTSFVYPSKDTMLKEFKHKNIGFNFSTGKSEIPKNIDEIKHLYKAHIKSKNYGDIQLIKPLDLPNFDLFTYSFPCKNISVAGNQTSFEKGSDTQSSLVWECEKIIKEKLPKYLLMENVENIIGKSHIGYFEEWYQTLDQLGYSSYWKVFNATSFGLPQNRERLIMVSILNSLKQKFTLPEGFELTTNLHDLLDKNVHEKYYIDPERYSHMLEDLPHQDISYCIDANYHKGGSVDNFISKKRRQLVQMGNLDNKIHSNTRVYDSDGLCPTINSMNGGDRQPKIYVGNKRIRRLTPIECWRLMGYSEEDFLKAKDIGKLADTKLYERAGRGIAVPMLEEIFKNLFFNIENL